MAMQVSYRLRASTSTRCSACTSSCIECGLHGMWNLIFEIEHHPFHLATRIVECLHILGSIV